MTARRVTTMWSFIGVVLMFVSVGGLRPVSQPQPQAFAASEQAIQAAPYAHAMWVKLSDLVPTESASGDVYVRLIAIEGEVLLPVDHVR